LQFLANVVILKQIEYTLMPVWLLPIVTFG